MNGYVYIASLNSAYYKAAVLSAQSLRDYYPEANITLYTHADFVQDIDRQFFNNIVTGIPIHVRAKMWGMARTPYEKTLYMDCDTEVRSERIKEVFDILGDNDIMFTKIIDHVSADKIIDSDNRLEYHGGIILYNNKPLTIELINDWYTQYLYQRNTKWDEGIFSQYNPKMQPWDQFTIWWLLYKNEKYKDIRHTLFPNGGHEWNYIYLLEYESLKMNTPYKDIEQIIYHYTIPQEKRDAGNIKTQSRTGEDFN